MCKSFEKCTCVRLALMCAYSHTVICNKREKKSAEIVKEKARK